MMLHCETDSSVGACNPPESVSASVISPTPSQGLSATSLTTLATAPSNDTTGTSEPNNNNVIAVYITVGVIPAVVVIAILITVVTLLCLRSAGKLPRSPKLNTSNRSKVGPRIQSTRQLLVLYSWGTSERNQQHIMQCLVSVLTCDMNLVYSAKSEVRGDIPQWVEKQINDSDKVLVVCNKQFSKECQSPGSTHTEGAIVNTLKAIITGHIISGTMDTICRKTALVFLKEKHKELVPSGILHSFKQYMLYAEDSDKQNELLRFISDTPIFLFCPQDEVKVMV